MRLPRSAFPLTSCATKVAVSTNNNDNNVLEKDSFVDSTPRNNFIVPLFIFILLCRFHPSYAVVVGSPKGRRKRPAALLVGVLVHVHASTEFETR